MIKVRTLSSRAAGFDGNLDSLLADASESDPELERQVAAIIQEIRRRGDAALLDFTNRLDHRNAAAGDLEVAAGRIESAFAEIPTAVRAELEEAWRRIRVYHERQKVDSWTFEDDTGVLLGQKVTPLDRIGVYIPGGRAAYPSTVLMNVIPARIAGVREIIMTVPTPGGELNPVVLAAARIAGVDRIFSIGGAQAIAALAYGTETLPAVDKIVGPGNRYVAAAKRQVFGKVGIDLIAGPSEVVIISDGTTNPDWIAMDLFAQAEHDEDARAILICIDERFLKRVEQSMVRLLPEMERAVIIRAALERHGAIIHVASLDEAANVSNRIAPEHLELAVADPLPLAQKIRHAGAIFLGCHSAEVLGDYCAGPNHVLPTGRSARFSSPLGVYDFQKRSSVIMCSPNASARLARTASVLARAEGLTAHARAAEYRLLDD